MCDNEGLIYHVDSGKGKVEKELKSGKECTTGHVPDRMFEVERNTRGLQNFKLRKLEEGH